MKRLCSSGFRSKSKLSRPASSDFLPFSSWNQRAVQEETEGFRSINKAAKIETLWDSADRGTKSLDAGQT